MTLAVNVAVCSATPPSSVIPSASRVLTFELSNVDTEVNPVPPLLAPNVPAPILFALISVFNAASPTSPSFICAALTASVAIET